MNESVTKGGDAYMTPKQLASELNIDPKRLRGYLRKEYARDASVKGTTWDVPRDAVNAARKRFAPKPVETT